MRFVWVKVFNYCFDVVFSKVIEDKVSLNFRGHSDGMLLLLFISVHYLET